MRSINTKRAGTVAALVAALTMMGSGAAFAAAASPRYQEPINPGGILGGAYAIVVAAINDADNQHAATD
jgi:ethanolamine transporter EutH